MATLESNSLVWLDALTPKQSRLAACLALHLAKLGYRTFVSCRDHECTAYVMRLYGVEPTVVGRYGSRDRLDKLVADGERVLKLTQLVSELSPAALVSYPNPSAARVAFGLGIPYVALNDTPHAEAANRLSLPLCTALIASEALRGELERFLVSGARVLYYRGVDEALWVKAFEPRGLPRELGLEPRRYVVVRPEEFKAAYYSWEGWQWVELIEQLRARGLQVVAFPRYSEQREVALRLGCAVPRSCVDGLELSYHALAVVTGGGTMAREAALLGIPSYYTFPLELGVSKYVEAAGFPLRKWAGDLRELADEVASLEEGEVEEKVARAKELMKGVETPEKTVVEVLEDLRG